MEITLVSYIMYWAYDPRHWSLFPPESLGGGSFVELHGEFAVPETVENQQKRELNFVPGGNISTDHQAPGNKSQSLCQQGALQLRELNKAENTWEKSSRRHRVFVLIPIHCSSLTRVTIPSHWPVLVWESWACGYKLHQVTNQSINRPRDNVKPEV